MTLKRRSRWRLTQGTLGGDAATGSPDVPADPREAAALGAALARQRDSLGVTQQQVADALGVSVDEVAALEAGTGPVGRRAIEEAIARYRRAVKQGQKSRSA
jgi:DNA-binding XRE family transcriptional regulator